MPLRAPVDALSKLRGISPNKYIPAFPSHCQCLLLHSIPASLPQAVDYLGVDASRQLLLFAASSPEALRDIKLPLAAVSAVGAVDLHTDLLDQHMYVLSR